MKLAPIVLFAYDRLGHLRLTIEALSQNVLAPQSDLIIYSDGPKNLNTSQKINDVRSYLKSVGGFRSIRIVEQAANLGLAQSVVHGVSDTLRENDNVIVLEDDMVTSPYFLSFMNKALEMYADDFSVASVHGYVYPILNLPKTFFLKGADCWGWATWSRAWKHFEPDGAFLLNEVERLGLQREIDFDNSYQYTQMLRDQVSGKNNSWAVRWYVSTYLKGMLTLYPGKSYVQNIGHDLEGTHCVDATNIFDGEMNLSDNFEKIEVRECTESRKKFAVFLKSLNPSLLSKIKRYLSEKFYKVINSARRI